MPVAQHPSKRCMVGVVMTGLKKISELTGLSTATVSHVLNGTRNVSKKNREKVFQVAKSIGYRPNIAARMLRTKKSRMIAIIIPSDIENSNANYFYMDVIMGVREKAYETKYEVIVSTYDPHGSDDRSFQSVQVLKQRWIDGVIIVPSLLNNMKFERIKELEIPIVLLDRRVDENICCVASDNAGGVVKAIQLFADSGKRKIGFIGGVETTTGQQRYKGYIKAMSTLGNRADKKYICLCNRFSLPAGMSCAQKLINEGVDAIFVADNVMMIGALRSIKANNLKIPEDIGLIGFDDFDWMENTSPPLTTVKQETYQMGYAATELLLKKINGADVNNSVILDTTLVIRKSHGK